MLDVVQTQWREGSASQFRGRSLPLKGPRRERLEPFNFASFLGEGRVLGIGFLGAITRNGGVCVRFFYLLLALLNFQLLPQPPLARCRGGARPRVSGRGSRVSTRTVLRSGFLPRECQAEELLLKETGGMLSAESKDGSPGCAPVCRHPPLVVLPWSQPALPASLL